LAEPIRTVAVLVANPALSSILSMTLAGAPSLRVRPFESQLALTTYLRLAPVDLIVADFDSETARADRLAEELHADSKLERRDFQVIALASSLDIQAKAASMHAGIDEIIMKPMSPKYLVERVLARLARRMPSVKPLRPVARTSPPAEGWARFGDNVVPLFGRSPEVQH
jgi:response regulator RpfG family c-di-GMP phosphodiesterase